MRSGLRGADRSGNVAGRMGWLVWIVETLLCAASSYAVAAAVYPDKGVLHRLIATLIVAPSLILIAIQALGLFDVLRPLWLGLLAPVVFAAPGWLAARRLGRERLVALVRSDLGAPGRWLREVWREKDPAGLVVLGGALVLLIATLFVWIYRSWTWDPVWYHVPITSYTIALESIRWIESSVRAVPWMISHPRNVELLAVWNCIFPMDSRLDDSSQLLFGVLGAAVVTAWSRELGARKPFAAGLGAAWLLLPPVFLQIWSTHVDVACGAALGAAVFFLRGQPTSRDRWMCLLALGLYIGTKMTGLFHLALLGPWIAARAGIELWHAQGHRLRKLGDIASSVIGLLAVGSFKYIENTILQGNPFYAFRVKVPLLGQLPGVYDPAQFYDTPAGKSPLFFGADGAIGKLLRSWYSSSEAPTFWPDVRTGGFGPVFAWLLVPALLLLFLELARPRRWSRVLPILALFFGAIVVQSPWWPRFIMGASIAGLVALGYVHAQLPFRAARLALSVAFVALTGWTFWQGAEAQLRQADLFMYPKQFHAALTGSAEDRATLQVVNWLWPEQWAKAKEAEFQPGDVLVYDDSVYFLGEYFTSDYRNRPVYVPSNDVKAFLARVDELGARWVGVQVGSAAERALKAKGAEFLFVAPVSKNAVYRVRR